MKKNKTTDTLLINFIKEKMSGYSEPQRKGIPKGDPIDFSKKKYLASLLSLDKFKLVDKAKVLDISYGVLRRFQIEERFKDMVEKHCDEFADIFINFIHRELSKESDDISKKELKEISEEKIDINYKGLDELRDINDYSNLLVEKIHLNLANKMSLMKNKEEILIISSIIPFMFNRKGPNNFFNKPLKDQYITTLKEILMAKKITDKDRKIALRTLAYLEVL